jgi:Domain of unknown function (DUF4349)
MKVIVPAALLAMLCFSCNSVRNKEAKVDAVTLAPVASGAMAADTSVMVDNLKADKEDEQVPPSPGSPQQRNKVPAPPPVYPDWDRKIIKTADLHIEVNDFQRYTSRLHNAVKASGGYIAQEELTQSSGEIDNTVSIKVPVDRFDNLLLQLPSDSDRLVEKKITSEDVTMEFVDTKSKLETKKEVRERYLDLLKQARSMKDIIAIQNEINDIQEEMDQASGRITWLGHSAAYSTVNLRFYQVLDARVREDPSPSFFRQLKNSVVEGWKGFSSLLLGMISVWPLWIALIFGTIWIKKLLLGIRSKPETARVVTQVPSAGGPKE